MRGSEPWHRALVATAEFIFTFRNSTQFSVRAKMQHDQLELELQRLAGEPFASADPAIALWLQSWSFVGRVVGC